MSRAAVIIPVHNRRETTLACLRHLRATGDLENFRVIVVDDGSTDGTGEQLRTQFGGIEILHGDGNLWWTGAIALGMTHAFGDAADAVIWLNDDCWPDAGTLPALLAHALAPPEKITAPACFDAETGAAIPNAFVGRAACTARHGETIVAEGLSGYCVAVPRAVWSRIGAPDARRFPHYFGDGAYTLTATRAGFSAIVLGSVRAQLVNLWAATGPTRPEGFPRNWRKDFDRTFMATKSPYRMQTLFAYQQLKYGPFRGALIAAGRASAWIARFAFGGLRR